MFIDELQQLGDQGSNENMGHADSIKKLKAPRRINHKGETMLHVLAIKVTIKALFVLIIHVLCT